MPKAYETRVSRAPLTPIKTDKQIIFKDTVPNPTPAIFVAEPILPIQIIFI
jgi:hypothetical protein